MKKSIPHLPLLLAQTGTYSLADLRANGAYGNQTLAEFGVPNALAVVNTLTQQYNQRLTQSLTSLADTTTERFGSEAVGGAVRMERVSEYTNVRTQKAGSSVGRGFPLHAFNAATGWTEHFEAITTVASFVQMTEQVQGANDDMTRNEIMVALFRPDERDIEEDIISDLNIRREVIEGGKVKPLYNGDGEIPVTANGSKLPGTHSHYLGSNGLSNEALDVAVQTVAEHSRGNQIVINISEANVADFMALPGFIPARLDGTTPALGQQVANFTLDLTQNDSRNIGYTKSGYLVRTRPWVPKGYAVPWNLAANASKVLRVRVPTATVFRGLRLRGQEGNTILKARTWENQMGVGVSNRGGAAVLKFDAADGRYAVPAVVEDIDL